MGTAHAKEFRDDASEAEGGISLEGISACVDKVHVDGLGRTKDDLVVDTLKDLFQAKNLKEVVLKAQDVRGSLEKLGCFRGVGIFIDTSSGPDSSPDGLEVTFFVKELRRIIGGINTLVGDNEGSLVVGLKFPNLFGQGEKIQTEYSYGTKRTTGFNSTMTKPLRGKANSSVAASIYQQVSEWPWSGYRELDRGMLFDLAFESAPQVQHNLQWETVWRDLGCLSRSTAFAVREHSGHSLKSSLKHILTVDHRDSTIFPSEGVLFKLNQEFAGLGGDVGFFKNEMQVQANLPLPGDLVLQTAFNGGILKRLNNDKTFSICDRFFLGGPLNLRGFDMRGVGPQSDGNALGAEVFWSAAAHLYTPLPFRPGRGGFGEFFRTHLFFNAGNIGDFKFTDDFHHNLNLALQNLRVAAGIGIALRLGQVARVELNYCLPYRAERGDRVVSGLQFGVGLTFL